MDLQENQSEDKKDIPETKPNSEEPPVKKSVHYNEKISIKKGIQINLVTPTDKIKIDNICDKKENKIIAINPDKQDKEVVNSGYLYPFKKKQSRHLSIEDTEDLLNPQFKKEQRFNGEFNKIENSINGVNVRREVKIKSGYVIGITRTNIQQINKNDAFYLKETGIRTPRRSVSHGKSGFKVNYNDDPKLQKKLTKLYEESRTKEAKEGADYIANNIDIKYLKKEVDNMKSK